MKFTKLLMVTVALVSIMMTSIKIQYANAATMRCERYLVAGENKLTGGMRAFNRDYPELLIINQTDLNKFKKLPTRPVIRYTRKINFKDSQAKGIMQYYLFPNKKLRVTHPQVSDIRAAWKCDMTPKEVLATQSTDRNSPSLLSDEKLCSTATVTHDLGDGRAKRRWNSAMKSLKEEAEKRGLDCSVGQITGKKTSTDSSTSESMSLDKAKAECASLGFTAGTEKHGDCVMKLMGN